jgi:hypothetical protein
LSKSPIIQCVSQFLLVDSGVLDGIGRVSVPEFPLHWGNISGLTDKVSAHGMSGVMGRVAPTPLNSQTSFQTVFDHPQKQRPRLSIFKTEYRISNFEGRNSIDFYELKKTEHSDFILWHSAVRFSTQTSAAEAASG